MQAWQYENLLPEEVKNRGRGGSDGKVINDMGGQRKGREITAKTTVSSKIIEKRRYNALQQVTDNLERFPGKEKWV